jgi:hypothetical protein
MQKGSTWLLSSVVVAVLGAGAPALAESGDGESVYIATARSAGLQKALDAAAGKSSFDVLSTVATGTPGPEFGAAVSAAARESHGAGLPNAATRAYDTPAGAVLSAIDKNSPGPGFGDAVSEAAQGIGGGSSRNENSNAGRSADALGGGGSNRGGGDHGGGSDRGGGGGRGGGRN